MTPYFMILNRLEDNQIQTLGRLFIFDSQYNIVFNCVTLELAWRNNQSNISCIPPGKYIVQRRHSITHDWHLHIQNVPNRTYILFHAGNYNSDTKGCILPGQEFKKINNDVYMDISSSTLTMKKLMTFFSETTQIELIINPVIHKV